MLKSVSSVQSLSCVQLSWVTLCDPMDWNIPGFPVHHQLPEPTQNHVHRVGDAIQSPHPLLSPLLLSSIFPSIGVFSIESALHIRWPKYWTLAKVSASTSVLPRNIQDWFPLGLTGWISLQSKGLSRVLPNTAVQKHQFFSAKLSLWPKSHIQHDYWKNHSFDQMDLCDYMDWMTKHSTVPVPAPQQSLWEVAYHSLGSPHSHLWGSLVV